MGVFKWLRRERVTVTSRHSVSPAPTTPEPQPANPPVDPTPTEEYKRDLAEFQARRSLDNKELHPLKKKCGKHSLTVSCTDCAVEHKNSFSYEKKPGKYKKKSQKRATSEEKSYGAPNIQFLFQNQVFMPGNRHPMSYSEPPKHRHQSRHRCRSPVLELTQKRLDFDDTPVSPPLFFKNNSLPFDVKNFMERSHSDDVVDGAGDVKSSCHSSCESQKDTTQEKLWEVMNELKNFDRWADEQLQYRSGNTTKSEDSNCDTSVYGLPVATASDVDVAVDKSRTWSQGKWGVVPVQVKRLNGVVIEHVKKKLNTEINILRKCRHPNVILLMGLFADFRDDVHIICEYFIDTLYHVIHTKGRIISAQTSVHYGLDVASALVYLRMHGYVHTGLSSAGVAVTGRDVAKLVELGPCGRVRAARRAPARVYDTEPQYVNVEDTRETPGTVEQEPLISQRSSETFLSQAVAKEYETYRNSQFYRWQAPELFEPDEAGMVHPCSKSDVYALCLVLWECCNAALPFKDLSYNKLRETYSLWKTGLHLPTDGTYPGSLLSLLQSGLQLDRSQRIDLSSLQNLLQTVKQNLDNLEYMIIPARVPKKNSGFSSVGWDSSPTESDLSPKEKIHKVIVHSARESSTESEKEKSDLSPLYETIRKDYGTYSLPEKCYISDEDVEDVRPKVKYDFLPEKEYSSVCSTPIAKLRTRVRNTPGLQRSDSTEYCSIFSPDNRGFDTTKSVERPLTKLSKSFTPKSYKPLHIKVPDYNLDCIKSLRKDNTDSGKSSYNFDIKNYSLPSTPIARSNKLRKNAWLSGELSVHEKNDGKIIDNKTKEGEKTEEVSPNKSPESINTDRHSSSTFGRSDHAESQTSPSSHVPESSPDVQVRRNSWCNENAEVPVRRNSWSITEKQVKPRMEDEVLAAVNVKPLVAIHEKWIYEANKKTRCITIPEDRAEPVRAVKPASHLVDVSPKPVRRAAPEFRAHDNGIVDHTTRYTALGKQAFGLADDKWEQYCYARDVIAKNIDFTSPPKLQDRVQASPQRDQGTQKEAPEAKVDQSTDTKSIEEFIRDLIRKEFHYLIAEISDENSKDDALNKGVANILESLDDKPDIKSFSRVKINGNNKPLLQITFNRSGESSLQVLDNCVNVTFCDSKEKNTSVEEPVDDFHVNSLKRCQAFNAIQEARSTEDLYIDDDLSTHMQENFGGKVKLIPLHGSLHEVLCEKEDDCCLIKVKQENGCDTIYFRCDNSDTESRDAIDGCPHDLPQDTVVYKRSISLVEERIQRVFPKDKRGQTPREAKLRPKSEVFVPRINKQSRVLSNSSPSLTEHAKEEVEVNIENVMCYQDSSSDECLKCQTDNDDFELLERKIEEDLANASSFTCGCLEKISEENLSLMNEDISTD